MKLILEALENVTSVEDFAASENFLSTTCLTRWNGTKFQTNTAALEEPMLHVWAVVVVATQK